MANQYKSSYNYDQSMPIRVIVGKSRQIWLIITNLGQEGITGSNCHQSGPIKLNLTHCGVNELVNII